MKLRNKKTGEIKDWSFAMLENIAQIKECKPYASLAELNEEWEDYEEERPQQRYYLMNKKTGYIATFNSLDEADTFRREVEGWRFVKVY